MHKHTTIMTASTKKHIQNLNAFFFISKLEDFLN